jgi:hypothetical protein
MIRFSGTVLGTATKILGIGLSRKNIEELLSGKSISFRIGDIDGLPAMEIAILAGDTDESIHQQLHDMGALVDAPVKTDASLNDPYINSKWEVN